ncbi:ribosome biogenesis protein NOP53-like isoform X2 [Babylonia areolata]|uniref:ribosome biogenesis protein NOP53-like isoform X2 n=1 Tax=Babylonia areolata TaxID=304850 RepID=UPI003FD335AA
MSRRMDGPKFSKRRKLGKNKKKSWRGIDITETEDFLEDQRFQQRTTGLVAEKTNDQLFIVERKRAGVSAQEAPKKKAKKDLNCYSNLVNRSRIECPRKEYPTAEEYSLRSLRAFSNKVDSCKKTTTSIREKQHTDSGEALDLWGEEKTETEGDDFFNEVTKRKRVKTPQHIKRKCSARPAVEVPHAGASVNPAYDDHQDLLLKASAVELKKQKAERRIFNALDAKFPSASEAPSEATWLEEMSAGLYEDPSADQEEVDDGHISINPPVSRDRKKTPRDRRKEKAAKLVKHVMAQKKETKGTENKVYSIAKIRSELARERREAGRRAQVKAIKVEAKRYAPRKLGRLKAEEPEMEVKLSDQLVGNLRSVKPEGSVMEDRYRSMQMRNLLEARTKAHKKKTKTKKFEKKSFREITA